MTTQSDEIVIDVVSDVVCPWCFVGKRRLEQALESLPDVKATIRWRPFQLDPMIPAAGLDRKDYLEKKLGGAARVAQIHERIEGLGHDVGIDFAFEKMRRAPNTLDAHRLLYWAEAAGLQEAMAETLFTLNFEQGADIGDHDVLTRAAADVGLDAATVAEALANGTDRDHVLNQIEAAQRMGVTGVPFFVFNGQFAVSGAQGSDVLVAAIRKARDSGPAIVAA